MEITLSKHHCIIKPFAKKIDLRECKRILEAVADVRGNALGFDLSFVEECSFEFIDYLKNISSEIEISLYNIPSDVFVLLSFMKLDKSVKLFVNEIDFKASSHQLIMRKFSVL